MKNLNQPVDATGTTLELDSRVFQERFQMTYVRAAKKIMFSILTVTLFATFGENQVFAGGVSTGGGAAVFCKRGGTLKSVTMLDLYENRGYTFKDSNDSVETLVTRAMEKLERSYPDGRQRRQVLIQAINDIVDSTDLVAATTNILVPSDAQSDSHALLIEDGCELGAAAFYEKSGRLLVSQKAYEKMNQTNRAALLLHEAVYLAHRKMVDAIYKSQGRLDKPQYDIEGVRQFVAVLVSEQSLHVLSPTAENVYYSESELNMVPFIGLEKGSMGNITLVIAKSEFSGPNKQAWDTLTACAIGKGCQTPTDLCVVFSQDPTKGFEKNNVAVACLEDAKGDNLTFRVSFDDHTFRQAKGGFFQGIQLTLRTSTGSNQYKYRTIKFNGNPAFSLQNPVTFMVKYRDELSPNTAVIGGAEPQTLMFHSAFGVYRNEFSLTNTLWGKYKEIRYSDVKLFCQLEVRHPNGKTSHSEYRSLHFVNGAFDRDMAVLSLPNYLIDVNVPWNQKDPDFRTYNVTMISNVWITPESRENHVDQDLRFRTGKPSQFSSPPYQFSNGDKVNVRCKTDGKVIPPKS